MLLVTLVFVLTTRGINLDLTAASRSGLRADHSSPISSPPLKRSSSMLFGQSFLSVSENPDASTKKLKRKGTGIQHFNTINASVQSAPVTPAGVPRVWQITSTSPLVDYAPPSPDETFQDDEGSSIDEPSSSRQSGTDAIDDEFMIMGSEGQMVRNRYLTPLSNLDD